MDILKIAKKFNHISALGIIPTDTVYGLAAKAQDEKAVTRLYNLKKRIKKPGTLITANIEQLTELGIKRKYLLPFTRYWPNPLSVVVPCPELDYLHQGINSLAIRIPKNTFLNELLRLTGPLMTSSANPPGLPEAKTILEAKRYFGKQIDFYVDGGNLSQNKPSTIVQMIDDQVVIIRQGEYLFKP